MTMHNIDYDLFVLDPKNMQTKVYQFRDCVYAAIEELDERTKKLDKRISELNKLLKKDRKNEKNRCKQSY